MPSPKDVQHALEEFFADVQRERKIRFFPFLEEVELCFIARAVYIFLEPKLLVEGAAGPSVKYVLNLEEVSDMHDRYERYIP